MSYSQSGFVSQYLPYAVQTSQQTGLPVDFILAQSALETGWGSSNAAQNYNNFFGISPGGSLASYGSPAEGFSAFGNLLSSPAYSGVSGYASQGPLALGNAIQAAGYNPNPAYGGQIASLVPQIDQLLQGTGNGQYATGGYGNGQASTGAQGGGNCGFSPNCWLGSIGQWAGSYALRAGFFVVAIILLLGAVYLFGKRTEGASG